MSNPTEEIDVRKLEPEKKHPAVFKAFNNLNAGESFVIINDHDPRPLKFQIAAEHADDKFLWEYLEKDPEVWKIRIGKINY